MRHGRECSEPSPVSDKPQEHPMMAKSQANRHLINCKCQRIERCGMTCQDTEPLDEYVKGTCYTDGRESQIFNTCGCKKPQHKCNCQATESPDENVKFSCYTDSGESQITITCGCKKPFQNCDHSKVSGKSNDSFSG